MREGGRQGERERRIYKELAHGLRESEKSHDL